MASFIRNNLVTFFTETFLFISSFITTIILTRVLGPTGKGIYSLTLLIPGILFTFGNLNIGLANSYFVGSKKYTIQDVVSNSLFLAIVFSFISTLIFLGIFQFNFFQKFIYSNQISPFYLWILVLSIPISLLLAFFRGVIGGKGEIINSNKTRILENAISLIAVIVFLLILKGKIFGAVISNVLAGVGACLLSLFFVKKMAKIRFSLNKSLLKQSVIYGGKVTLANSFSFLNYRSDVFFLAFYLTPAAVGFYSIATGVAEQLFMISGTIASVLFFQVCSSSSSEANDFTSKISRHTFLIMLISSLMLLLLATPLITIVFGSSFLPSVKPLILLLPGIFAFGIGGVLAADLSGRGKPEFAVYSSFACLVIDTILNFALIPRWGVSGASIASSISYSVDTLIIIIAFAKISKKPLKEFLLIKKEDFKDYLRILSNFKNWILLKKTE